MICVRTLEQFDRLQPAQKLIVLFVAMAGRDRATSLRFDCYPDIRIDVWYFVDGLPYQLVPPPCAVWPFMIREFCRQMTIATTHRAWWRRRRSAGFPQTPAAGHLALQFAHTAARPAIAFFRGRTGEHVEIETTHPDLRRASDWFFSEWARHDRDHQLLIEFEESDLFG
jgi:hypothetical protein